MKSGTLSLAKKKKISLERKVREYRRFLKDDSDHDWISIISMLRYKLERTRTHISENNRFPKTKQVVNEITTVVKILKRIEADRYMHELRQPFYKKNCKPSMTFGNLDEHAGVSCHIVYQKETSPKERQIIWETLSLGKEELRLRQADLEKAFELILKNIWKWWD